MLGLPAGAVSRLGAYVHLHGGAFLMRYPQMDDFFCRHVAAECGLVVVNVDYDVAPQKRYPVAQEQAHDVLAWVADHPAELGVPASGGRRGGGRRLQRRRQPGRLRLPAGP